MSLTHDRFDLIERALVHPMKQAPVIRDRRRGSSAHQFFLQRGATPAHAIEHAPFLHTEMPMSGRALNLKNLVRKFTER